MTFPAGCQLFAQPCGPSGCPPPRLIRIIPRSQTPQHYPADPASTRPTLAAGEASIDHSQFALKSDLQQLQKLQDQTKANVQKVADATNQMSQHSQSVAARVEQVDQSVKQHVAGLAAQIADAERQLKAFEDTPAGEATTKAAGATVAQFAGADAALMVKLAATFGGPTAAIAALIGWLALRKLNRLGPLQAAAAQLRQAAQAAANGPGIPPATGLPPPSAHAAGQGGAAPSPPFRQ